jgi:hypothetical protein
MLMLTTKHGQRLVSIERSNLYRDNVFDLREALPEAEGKQPSTNGGLQVEADDGENLGHCPDMGDQIVDGGIFERCQTQKARVVAFIRRERRFLFSLLPFTANTCNPNAFAPAHFRRGEFEDRSEQSDLWIANFELRGVHRHSDPARARIQVIARQSALPALVQFSFGVQGKRMSGNHLPFL